MKMYTSIYRRHEHIYKLASLNKHLVNLQRIFDRLIIARLIAKCKINWNVSIIIPRKYHIQD